MTREEIEKEIGECSEIINKSIILLNAPLRNKILKHVGEYRQWLRQQL